LIPGFTEITNFLRRSCLLSAPMQKCVPEIHVVLASGQAILREGLRILLDGEPGLRVAAETGDGQELLRIALETGPDIAVVELRILEPPAFKLLQRIVAANRGTRVLVLAAAQEGREIAKTLRLGARGFVLRHSATKVLVQGIRAVSSGRYWFGHKGVSHLEKELRRLAEASETGSNLTNFGLTRREREIVAAVISGLSNREIARRFRISEETVKHHVTNVFDKLGVYNRLEMALFAIHHGLVARTDGAR
jgi:two-component system nitrate/nitrite response regulator NarL